MEWSNYFRTLERIYEIKIDSTLRNTIKNHFTEELYLFSEQDMYELTPKAIQFYCYRKINNKN
jgi:hypothetical protein